ncbi:MAG: hypothetical protein NVS3B7_15370 [Candidatus Elarobacter sp.]
MTSSERGTPADEDRGAFVEVRSRIEAYVTVTDASGRVLLRRAATAEEIAEARSAADDAERGARAALAQIAEDRRFLPPHGGEAQA